MTDDTGLALYRKAGELNMPVGVMCFKGFGLHVKEIEALLESSSETKVESRLRLPPMFNTCQLLIDSTRGV